VDAERTCDRLDENLGARKMEPLDISRAQKLDEQHHLLTQLALSWRSAPFQITQFVAKRSEEAERLDAISFDLYDNLLLQNLSTAFDDFPMRRVFPFCVSIDVADPRGATDEAEKVYEFTLNWMMEVIRDLDSSCDLIRVYPVLQGSKGARTDLKTRRRCTRRELPKEIQERDFAAKFKDFSEGVKNIAGSLSISVAVLLAGGSGMLQHQPQQMSPRPPVVQQIKRADQLKTIPKLLDASSPEEFINVLYSYRPSK
jgi:hypothetical protein